MYEKVGSGSAVKSVVIAWDPPASDFKGTFTRSVNDPTVNGAKINGPAASPTINGIAKSSSWELAISKTEIVAKDVLEITLKLPSDDSFPSYTLGAHIDVLVDSLG